MKRSHLGVAIQVVSLVLFVVAARALGADLLGSPLCTLQAGNHRQLGEAVDACAQPCCAYRDPNGSFTIMHDIDPLKPAALLIVPQTEIDGDISSDYTALPVKNYWQEAWEAARQRLHVPPEMIALAMNARRERNQNRLHIHIACASPDLIEAIQRQPIGPNWSPFKFPKPPIRKFRARTITALVDDPNPAKAPMNPFSIVSDTTNAPDLQNHSIVVLGMKDARSFYVFDKKLLPEEAKPYGYVEDFLDQRCISGRRDEGPA